MSNGDKLKLSKRPRQVWQLLLASKEEFVSREEIAKHIYGGAAVQPNNVDQIIADLRKELGAGSGMAIENLRGGGWRVVEVEASAGPVRGNLKGSETSSGKAVPVASEGEPRFPVCNVAPPAAHFTGRVAPLEVIARNLATGKNTAVTAVHGTGGIGKTQLVRRYAAVHVGEYDVVWWVASETAGEIMSGLARLARALGAAQKETDDKTAAGVAHEWLRSNSRWLLIFDNADSAESQQDVYGRARLYKGHVLITSRSGNWSGVAECLELDTWDRLTESIPFLQERTRQTDRDSADAIAEMLGDLPLALEQAAAYMGRYRYSLTDYGSLLKTDEAKLFDEAEIEKTLEHTPVAKTFSLSFERLAKEDAGAIDLLRFFAFLAPSDIFERLLSAPVPWPTEELTELLGHPERRRNVYALLDDLALAKWNPVAKVFSIHRVVQMLLRAKLPGEAAAKFAGAAVQALVAAWPKEMTEVGHWSAAVVLEPHALAASTWSLRVGGAEWHCGYLWQELGSLATWRGDLGSSEAHYQESLQSISRLAAQDPRNAGWQRDLSVSHNKLGDVRASQGDLDGALKAYEASLAIRGKLAAQDPRHAEWQRDRSVSHNKLGDVRAAQGDLDGALKAYEGSLAIAEKLAAQDPRNAGWQRDLSGSHEKLGDVRAAQGDLDGALKAYEASLAIRGTLTAQDPRNAEWQRDLSVSHNKLGDVRAAQGDLDGALKAYEAGLAIRGKLAAQDPRNAGWQYDLGISYERVGDVKASQGDLSGALRAYESKHAIIQTLTAQDPRNAGWQRDLSVSHEKLGNVRASQGDLDGARKAYDASLTIRQKLAAQDPRNAGWQRDLSVSHDKLGNVREAQGDLDGALKAYEAGLAIRGKLAAQDPRNAGWQRDVLASHGKLGMLAMRRDEKAVAKGHYVVALEIAERLVKLDPTNAQWREDLDLTQGLVERLG